MQVLWLWYHFFQLLFPAPFIFNDAASLLGLRWLVKMKHRCQSETQNELRCFSLVYSSHESAPVGRQDQCLMKILPSLFFPFLNLRELAMCSCPMWVCERTCEVFFYFTFGRMQEFTGVWVRDPRIQKEDFWHAYMDYEICIHVSEKIKIKYRTQNSQTRRQKLIILCILYSLRQTVWPSLRSVPVCGGDTASLCG